MALFLFFLLFLFIHIGLVVGLKVGFMRLVKPKPDEPHQKSGVFVDISAFDGKPTLSVHLPPISVIVCARNEAENLPILLPILLSQNYPNYEVVIVDDHSTDNTSDILAEFEEKYPHLLKVVRLTEPVLGDWSPKKYALQCGLLVAEHDYLLFTDADCEPTTEWIRAMAAPFAEGKSISIGYSPYRYAPTFLNFLIRYETFHTAFLYFSAAGWRRPYMGVGRNLGFHRKLYQKMEQNAQFSRILSGIDDLPVNHLANSSNFGVVLSSESFVVSEPKRAFTDWFFQKTRHVSSSPNYRFGTKLFLGAYHLSHLAVYFCLVWAFVKALCFNQLTNDQFLSMLIFWAGGLVLKGVCFLQTNQFLREKSFGISLICVDLFYPIYSLTIAPLGLLTRPLWKKNYRARSEPKKTES